MRKNHTNDMKYQCIIHWKDIIYIKKRRTTQPFYYWYPVSIYYVSILKKSIMV